ncbi:MAG: hypothetical protein NT155_01905 [Candidatus Staskawiczbacteria bacterium]|nr:hypothetical protein [Candidatus Staskawiczbacteria bacterium]
MENQEVKQLIADSKNIYLIPSEEPEAVTSALALFYTLKDLAKNVNLVIENLPENLKFLSPSLDFISYPKNFVISVPNNVAQVSQIYYEKNNDDLKIHLTIESGNIKKENILFYFAESKPDLIITLGIKDYQKELSDKLNSFGFLLDSPVVNIDNSQDNQKFGKINLIEDKSLSEIIFGLTENVKKESATCLLTGLVLYTGNFKNKITAEIFQISSVLMKLGASLMEINKNIKF